LFPLLDFRCPLLVSRRSGCGSAARSSGGPAGARFVCTNRQYTAGVSGLEIKTSRIKLAKGGSSPGRGAGAAASINAGSEEQRSAFPFPTSRSSSRLPGAESYRHGARRRLRKAGRQILGVNEGFGGKILAATGARAARRRGSSARQGFAPGFAFFLSASVGRCVPLEHVSPVRLCLKALICPSFGIITLFSVPRCDSRPCKLRVLRIVP